MELTLLFIALLVPVCHGQPTDCGKSAGQDCPPPTDCGKSGQNCPPPSILAPCDKLQAWTPSAYFQLYNVRRQRMLPAAFRVVPVKKALEDANKEEEVYQFVDKNERVFAVADVANMANGTNFEWLPPGTVILSSYLRVCHCCLTEKCNCC